jgi:hypothetical protein
MYHPAPCHLNISAYRFICKGEFSCYVSNFKKIIERSIMTYMYAQDLKNTDETGNGLVFACERLTPDITGSRVATQSWVNNI